MEIIEVKEYSDQVLSALNVLIPQLSSSAEFLDEAALRSIIENASTHLLIAKEGGTYYGALTVVVLPIPTGIRAWIEDVVVSEEARGKGVGKLLSNNALELAFSLGAKTVDLTSRPSRVAANELYKQVGFVQRDTNVYRYSRT
ncbi:MAG: GNAT family N-acetyltransferase [Gammaproteobacteria bacterium]|nr:GNAT family N-acetyltransferase [Gammaproteobacteria bacterium]